MEKKEIDKKFFLLSAFNIIPAFILAGGFNLDFVVLVGALAVLVINHLVLVNIVKALTQSASEGAQQQLGKILFLMFLKFALLFSLIALIYLYKKELLTKLFLVIFFQLIIQVLSIKNNYLK